MKTLFIATILGGWSLVVASTAHAQTGPAFPTPGQGSSEATPRRNTGKNSEELVRNQRRAAMTPEEIKRDQQMELLEARTGNTSFSRNGGPERQFDANRSGGGFTVRKFKAKPGSMKQKRGMSHPIAAADPAGKPLVHKHKRKKKYLLF
ncbi:MAG TPA: hypothetical protein VF690_04140 [Hymenobacter sp.]|jgi:hypothetical protein